MFREAAENHLSPCTFLNELFTSTTTHLFPVYRFEMKCACS